LLTPFNGFNSLAYSDLRIGKVGLAAERQRKWLAHRHQQLLTWTLGLATVGFAAIIFAAYLPAMIYGAMVTGGVLALFGSLVCGKMLEGLK
jgi:hypothetical protein